MNKDVYKIIFARTLTEFAKGSYIVILPLIILHITHSLSSSGIFFVFCAIPNVLIAPFLGAWIENKKKKKMIGCTLCCMAILFFVLTILFISNFLSMWILAFFSVLLNIMFSILDISEKVLFSEIVQKDYLEKANGTKSLLENISIFTSPIIGTFLYSIFGSWIVTFLSFFMVVFGLLFIFKIKKNDANSFESDDTVKESEFFLKN